MPSPCSPNSSRPPAGTATRRQAIAHRPHPYGGNQPMHVDESLLAHVEDTRRFNEQYFAAMSATPLGFATAEDALRTRAFLDAAVVPLPPERLQPQVMSVGSAAPAVEVRVFVPERPQGVCVQFHSGAWIIGSARAGDDRSAEIAERCSVTVVSVEYRMVPEALPPAQLDDALNVIDWVL